MTKRTKHKTEQIRRQTGEKMPFEGIVAMTDEEFKRRCEQTLPTGERQVLLRRSPR